MARRKSRTAKDRDLAFYSEMSFNNGAAAKEGPKKKTFSLHDLREIRPMNETQREFFVSYISGNHVIGNGSAGTGKSFISLYLALNDVLDPEKPQEKIIIVRSAVQGREIGFTPGDVNEKMAPYESPYVDIFADLFRKKTTYQDMKDLGKVEFMPTTFLRGNSWDNAVIFIDEIQNCNLQEILTIMTRCGKNSKIIAIGDMVQNDLIHKKSDISGMSVLLEIANRMPEFDIITFTKNDIVRSAFVRSFITAYEDVVGHY